MNRHLIDLAKNKLILLYILNYHPSLYNNHTLTNFILQNELMNYFLLNQYLTELMESKFIETNAQGFLNLTALGEEALNFFKYQITATELENLDMLLNTNLEALQPIKYSAAQVEDHLQLKATKGSNVLFELKVILENASPIAEVIQNFETNGPEILEKIKDLLKI